jgi:predicted SAM-dependent methyltransferase
MGVELGVAWGEFSMEILTRSRRLWLLYSIDRWTDPHHDIHEYERAIQRLESFGSRSRVLRATFEEALVLFKPESLDFVYVDGYAHTGQEGGKTLEEWWPKIKPGGVMAGHDYDPLFQPTIDAVDAFVARHGLELHLTEEEKLRSWWVVKK